MDEKEKLLQEAKRRYPVGTVIRNPFNEEYIANVHEGISYEIIDADYHFKENDTAIDKTGKISIWGAYTKDYNLAIYSDGQWAEIVPKPERKPKRGDRVLVWDEDGQTPLERIYITTIEGVVAPFVVIWEEGYSRFVSGKNTHVYCYKNMQLIPSKKIITRDEILEHFNCDDFEIV